MSRFGLAVRRWAGKQKDLGSIPLRLSSHFKKVVVCGHCLVTVHHNETLKWLSLLPILMQESFWWWQCTDRYIISLFHHHNTPLPPFSPSLISLMVSVDVKHHVYLLIDGALSISISRTFFNTWASESEPSDTFINRVQIPLSSTGNLRQAVCLLMLHSPELVREGNA